MNFDVYEASTKTKVAKIYAFPHWDLAPETPEFLKYIGPSYVLYNEATNCAKGIDEPATKVILDTCEEQNFIDPKLQKWVPHYKRSDPREVKLEAHIIGTKRHTFVYCFPKEIEIYNTTALCPNAVIKLPKDVAFTTGNRTYKPTKGIRTTITLFNDVLGSVQSRHVASNNGNYTHGMSDHMLMEAKIKLKRMKKINAESVSAANSWLYEIGYYTVVTFCTILTLSIIYCCWKWSCISKLAWLFTQNHSDVATPRQVRNTMEMRHIQTRNPSKNLKTTG